MSLIFAVLFTFSPGAPLPQPVPTLHERNNYRKAEFKLLDANGDRQISRDEYLMNTRRAIENVEKIAKKHRYETRMVSQLFARNRKGGVFPPFAFIDTNGNGRIHFHKEFLKFPSATFADFCRWDLNGDGKIPKAEYLKSRAQEHRESFFSDEGAAYRPPTAATKDRWMLFFALRDANKDGRMTWAEMRAHFELMPNVMAEGMFADADYVLLDANFDGVVSRDEFLARARNGGDEDFLRLKQKVFRLRDLNGDGKLTYKEFAEAGENAARGFVMYDKNGDGVIEFKEMQGIQWVAGKNIDRDRCYFARFDANGDGKVTWKEYRSASPRTNAFGTIDHLKIDNTISKKEWDTIKRDYLVVHKGHPVTANTPSNYATYWFPGIFDLITFQDVDANKDGSISWDEFRSFAE